MLGHYHFSQKQMHGKNNSEVQDMLMLEKDINWNDIDTWKKRGCCYHSTVTPIGIAMDEEIPIFSQQRDYIDTYVQ
jgi:tRNA(His) 5'-end guanylyltransferase